MTVVVHQASEKLLQAAQAQQPHGVILYGEEGIGLRTIAREYFEPKGSVVLEVLPEKNEKVDIEKGVITIESIRRLYDTLRTTHAQRRVIIIDYAERMGIPAQNAFLKLLEEPPAQAQFILLSHAEHTLLPTIKSRVQPIELRRITTVQSNNVLDALGVKDDKKRAQLLFIANGLPAELTRLVQDDAYFAERAEIITDARLLVSGSPYDRLLLAKKYKDTRAKALTLLGDASKQLRLALTKDPSERMLGILTKLEVTQARLVEQGNVRLQLSSLVAL